MGTGQGVIVVAPVHLLSCMLLPLLTCYCLLQSGTACPCLCICLVAYYCLHLPATACPCPQGVIVVAPIYTTACHCLLLPATACYCPQGVIVAAPIYAATGSRWKALGLATASVRGGPGEAKGQHLPGHAAALPCCAGCVLCWVRPGCAVLCCAALMVCCGWRLAAGKFTNVTTMTPFHPHPQPPLMSCVPLSPPPSHAHTASPRCAPLLPTLPPPQGLPEPQGALLSPTPKPSPLTTPPVLLRVCLSRWVLC